MPNVCQMIGESILQGFTDDDDELLNGLNPVFVLIHKTIKVIISIELREKPCIIILNIGELFLTYLLSTSYLF